MSKFLLSDKNFESVKAQVGNTSTTLEILDLDNGYYGVFEHVGDHVFPCGEYNKLQLKTLWKMLTTEK